MTKLSNLINKFALEVIFLFNDTFYYASADAAEIPYEDLKLIEDVIERYDFAAIIAYEAIRRKHDPEVPSSLTVGFYEAKKEIEALVQNAVDEDRLWDFEWAHEIHRGEEK